MVQYLINTCSHCICIISIFLVIFNFLGSLGEDALFYFVYTFIIMVENDKEDEESFQKISKVFNKIMNNMEKDRRNLSNDDDDDDEKEKRKYDILKILPWISFNLNAVIQIIAFIFLLFLVKRIKNKYDFGVSPLLITQEGQGSSIQNQLANNKNSAIGLSDNNIFKRGKSKKKKKKEKKKKNGDVPPKEENSNPESDQININKKSKKSNKEKKKKNKSKEKKK